MERNGQCSFLEMNNNAAKKKRDVPPLFRRESCPPWLQFNKYIMGGYRCHLSTSQCVESLFYIHNETFNIYSHGIPCAVILIFVPLTASSVYKTNPLWFFIHFFACFAPFFASPIYHLFMCHRSGYDAYQNLLTFDVCGVWAINAFGGLCGIKSTFHCFPLLRSLCLLFYIFVSLFSIYLILVARNPKDRMKAVMVCGIMRYFYVGVRIGFYIFRFRCNMDSLPYYLSMELLGFIGGALNVARIPERWFPGKCDIFGNSHQIMHVLTVGSVVCLHIGSVQDFVKFLNENDNGLSQFQLKYCSVVKLVEVISTYMYS